MNPLPKVVLPQDIGMQSAATVEVYDYNTSRESTRQQVQLTMNTFSFLLEGHKEVFADTAPISISNAHFLLMKAGNCLMTEKLAVARDHYRSILLFFSNQSILDFARKYGVTMGESVGKRSVQAIPYDPFVRSFVGSLVEMAGISGKAKERILAVKLEELLLYLVDAIGPGFIPSLVQPLDDHTLHFLQVVEGNKLNKLSLGELAFLSNMSLSTFKRTFRRHFQESPSKWFQERRLEYAAFLLKHESRRPSDIFVDIGFESLSNFIQAFKGKYGQTPKQYQQG